MNLAKKYKKVGRFTPLFWLCFATACLNENTSTYDLNEPFNWVLIEGGSYNMGNWDPINGEVYENTDNEFPAHHVDIPTFYMWRTEVTVGQYRLCVIRGKCDPPDLEGGYCDYEFFDADNYPINCIDWYQAAMFCSFIGGRLPTESEWEYAARSRGQENWFPWGDDPCTCDLLIMDSKEGKGCGESSVWPVCSVPAGNTEQGLCDMAGNVYEWVEDWYHPSYEWEVDGKTYYAPDDGSAWMKPIAPGDFKVMRGGGIGSGDNFHTTMRIFHVPDWEYGGLGFRCAKNY